jgi:subtilase family serine protease
MSRTRTLTAAVGAMAATIGMTIGGASMSAQASAKPADTPVAGSAVPFTSHTQATGNVASSKRLSIQLWLRPRVAAAQRYASAVSTPGNALFHHYVSPDSYTARFGPSASEAGKVESWLRAEGFTSVHANPQRSYVRATAATSKINAAFHVQLKLYRASKTVNAGPYALRANNRSISLPSSLASSVLGVTGLDNAGPILPLAYQSAKPGGGPARKGTSAVNLNAPCSEYYGQHRASGLPAHFGEKKFPTELCGYSAKQLRAAYGATSQSTGTGQTIALVELGLTKDMFRPRRPSGTRSCRSARGTPAGTRSTWKSNSMSSLLTTWPRERTSS